MKEIEPNKPLLTSNMIPVYYDESDNNWHKADSSNDNSNYKWYDYGDKKWANAVTLYSDGGYKYSSKVITNIETSIDYSTCSADIVELEDGTDMVVFDYTSGAFYTEYNSEPSEKYSSLLQYIYLIDPSTYDLECGFDFENNTIGDLRSLEADEGKTIIDYMNEYINQYGILILRSFYEDTGESTIYYFDDSSAVVEEPDPYRISPVYIIQENITNEEIPIGSSFTFDEEAGIYNLSGTSDSFLTSKVVGKYMCDNGGSSCTKMYKINAVTNYSVTNADVYEVEKTKTQTNELTLADGSKKACSSSICTRNDYINAPNGTVIPMTNINTMLVWIPRYKYTYFASNAPTSIPITFENGTESTGTISCTDAIVANSGKSENCTDTKNGSIVKGKSTYTHPAFTFGDEELTGIWVGKFENSATEIPTIISYEDRTVIIKPNVQSWRKTDISYFANSIRNIELVNNIYGFPQTGTTLNKNTEEITGDSNNLDTHMMKNMEWGAVAYLSHSKYGMNSEVFINNSGKNGYNDPTNAFHTGRSGGNVGGSTPINGTYINQTSPFQYNTYGFYTYDGYLLNYGTTEKSSTRDLSKVASTTGNIYGIYDMSGGASEYVMANMQDSSNAFHPRFSGGTWSATNKPLDKYYDKYSYGTSQTDYTRGKLGDATMEMQPIGETGNWYSDYSDFVTPNFPWLHRGGYYSGDSWTGLFNFRRGGGSGDSGIGSRTILSVSP